MRVSDVLIIGSGIAGLSLAIKLNRKRPDLKITIVCKDREMQSNTRYAQGGISVVSDLISDSFEKHIDDTLKAGDGLCDQAVVENVICSAPACLSELEGLGVSFDRDSQGKLLLAKEGGHSASRVAHFKDMTGFEILVSLLIKIRSLPSITLLPFHTATDLITTPTGDIQDHRQRCSGARIYDIVKRKLQNHLAKVTVLASGGVGQVYKATTNPLIATGDGIAMAYRAGAVIQDMEFIQFHPTALFLPGPCSFPFLITEALRGSGATLQNNDGERFMSRYAPQAELARRDVVSRAIAHEIEESHHPCVYLDCRHLPPNTLKQGYPNVFKHCLDAGIDITSQRIPVSPAAHYLCGGIKVDHAGQTSIQNLYAAGECAYTGLHGANRLASNSLLEAIAYAEASSQSILLSIDWIILPTKTFPPSQILTDTDDLKLQQIRQQIQHQMTTSAGVIRTTAGLKHLQEQLDKSDHETNLLHPPEHISSELLELRNITTCAKLIVEQSLSRKVNRGSFYNQDFEITHKVETE